MYAELASIDSNSVVCLSIRLCEQKVVRISVSNHISVMQPCSDNLAHGEKVLICDGKTHFWDQTEQTRTDPN